MQGLREEVVRAKAKAQELEAPATEQRAEQGPVSPLPLSLSPSVELRACREGKQSLEQEILQSDEKALAERDRRGSAGSGR